MASDHLNIDEKRFLESAKQIEEASNKPTGVKKNGGLDGTQGKTDDVTLKKKHLEPTVLGVQLQDADMQKNSLWEKQPWP